MRRLRLGAVAFLVAAAGAPALANGVVAGKHNLSVLGPGKVRAQAETQVCVFCHVGHGADAKGQNRPQSRATYRPYESTTMVSPAADAPSGATRICLSCHDGTIAVGETLSSGSIAMNIDGEGGRLAGASSIGTDLRLTHPVSFAPVPSPKHRRPLPGDAVKLDSLNRVQCTSCHDPHEENLDPVQRKFLAKPNRYSEICTTCHLVPFWAINPSAHQSSMAIYDETKGAPAGYRTVAENGCGACHRSHAANESGRLLRGHGEGVEGTVCLGCHNGSVARKDVSRELFKPYSHLVAAPTPPGHDASEGPNSVLFQLPEKRPTAPRHATCVDCHNPHAALTRAAVAPAASGALAGVWGIDRSGNRVDEVRFEYEVCFKCHGDSANQPQASGPTSLDTLRRATSSTNLRRAFDVDAASAHPVVVPGRGGDVPSLIPPLSPSSQIYCGDCHASDDGASKGPHGSIYPHLLERNLSTADRTVESPSAYALCYKCHDRRVLLSDQSAFRPHRRHVVEQATPCTVCHAAHGVSSAQGNPVNNAHLVDFDVSVVRPTRNGSRYPYRSEGARRGTCSLTCHGTTHDETPY
ncbi:MAG: cytochrome c3 family protein [Myxococcaceae bacterium]